MVRRGGRHIFVGDPRQCIYGFTGALHDALDRIRRDFKCHTLPLSVCYRSGKKIVAYAQTIVSHILPSPDAIEGEVLSWGGDEFDAAPMLNTDAILCRVNAPLVTLAFSLIRRGIACKIEGKEIGTGLVALVSRWKVKKLETLRDRLATYRDREIGKAMAKEDAERADAIADKVNTLLVLVERAETLKLDVEGLKAMIMEMFSDDVTKQGLLTLCSYHKSKGREYRGVFLLDHFKHCPSKFAKLEHQIIAEENLAYVAITRAMERLVIVNTEEETLKKASEPVKEKVAA
jgi:superfamily I DNA/RNA helicase